MFICCFFLYSGYFYYGYCIIVIFIIVVFIIVIFLIGIFYARAEGEATITISTRWRCKLKKTKKMKECGCRDHPPNEQYLGSGGEENRSSTSHGPPRVEEGY